MKSATWKRKLCPFQCTNEPPSPCPGRKLSHRRIGSAVWSELLRKLTATFTLSCIIALRIEKRSSSWSATFEPDHLQSRLRKLKGRKRAGQADSNRHHIYWLQPLCHGATPFQLWRVSPDARIHVDMAVGILGEAHGRPVDRDAMPVDEVVIGGVGAGKSDHTPRHHVTDAAIDGVAEEALDRELPELSEEQAGRHAVEVLVAGLKAAEIGILLVGAHRREGSAGLCQLLVDRRERRVEELGGCERQLIALAWRALLPRAAAVESFAPAPGAGQLLVDVVRHGGFERARPLFIDRDQPRGGSVDEGGFLRAEKDISDRRRGSADGWRGRRYRVRSAKRGVLIGLCDLERQTGRQHRCADRLDHRSPRQVGHALSPSQKASVFSRMLLRPNSLIYSKLV